MGNPTIDPSRSATFELTGTNILLMSNGRMADNSDENNIKNTLHNLRKPNIRTKKVKEKILKEVDGEMVVDPKYLDDWYEEERKIQFFGLIYWDQGIGFHIPSDNILYMIRESYFGYGTTSKGGDRLLSILRTDKEAYPLEYDGPRTPEERWKAGLYRRSTVKNQALGGAKVRVIQPLFKNWSLQFTVFWGTEAERKDILGKGKNFLPENLYENLVWQGNTFGLGGYRKSGNYGNFSVRWIS